MGEFLTGIAYNRWILPTLLALPLLGALTVWLDRRIGNRVDGAASRAHRIALWTLVLEFALSAGLWWSLDSTNPHFQAVVDWPWIPTWGIRFSLGVDGISVMMILLTTLLMPIAILGGWTSIRTKVHTYHALMLILTTGMLGVFMATDLFLFYVMWEVMLVPMYFIIGIWGGERRIYAAIKFFLYTMAGSLLMLVAIVVIGIQAGMPGTTPNFSYQAVVALGPWLPSAAFWLFLAFFLAFAVKVPMFPFHTWLPDAHVEAPTAGSVILAGILLKMGTYGFLRLAVPLFPSVAMYPAVRAAIIVLAVIGIVYGSLVALVQPDIKKLVAYSSVAHLGFVMLGIFALTVESVQGALMVMIGHGLSTGALFLLVGIIYERRHTRLIAEYGGLARVVPLFATVLTIIALSSIGLPGTNGFVGEFLVLIGAFRTQPAGAVVAASGVILAAAYLLWALQRLIYQPLVNPANRHIADLNWREIGYLAPILVAVLWLGLYPKPVLQRMEASAAHFVQDVSERAARDPILSLREGR
jgi:NADH-quinone oxidoreductase subunit M